MVQSYGKELFQAVFAEHTDPANRFFSAATLYARCIYLVIDDTKVVRWITWASRRVSIHSSIQLLWNSSVCLSLSELNWEYWCFFQSVLVWDNFKDTEICNYFFFYCLCCSIHVDMLCLFLLCPQEWFSCSFVAHQDSFPPQNEWELATTFFINLNFVNFFHQVTSFIRRLICISLGKIQRTLSRNI